jgi:hypothetical protein
MSVLNARDVAPKQTGALFDVPLGKLLFFTESPKTVTNNHTVYSSEWEICTSV